MIKNNLKVFNQKVEQFLKLNKKFGKPKIAFGLAKEDTSIIKSLKNGQKYADIVIITSENLKNIKGFKIIVDKNPEIKLATMLAKDEVDGIIRGTIDDFKTYETYGKLTGEKATINPAFLEDPFGRQFFLSPASNPEGWDKEERLRISIEIAKFIKKWGIKPKIAVFTGERHETYPRKKHIKTGVTGILNKTYEDAEWIVGELKKQGYDAKNWAIDLNPAVEANYNILVPVNGMVGNQIFRVLLFCGGKVLAATRLGLSRLYEDNSRTEKDFEFHIKWLVALINQRRENKS